MEKEEVGALLCVEDKEGSSLLSLSDLENQTESAEWNREATIKIAHKMSPDFLQWLIEQADEGNWSKEDVDSIICRKDGDKPGSKNCKVLMFIDFSQKHQHMGRLFLTEGVVKLVQLVLRNDISA